MTPEEASSFRNLVYAYYKGHRRDLPWRTTDDPYCILVSEFMLQQTQVERVMDKYGLFILRFPDFASLAGADLKDVLNIWQGLGYNRRALSLKKLAHIIVSQYEGSLPQEPEELLSLPGVGNSTAGAVLAFAFHAPTVIIETNIRRVFIHHFFQGRENVRDREIVPLVEATIDKENPRDWYYALMDYGSMLRKLAGNANKRSAHYTRQAPFENSNRKLRGAILRVLLNGVPLDMKGIRSTVDAGTERIEKILTVMVHEGFIAEEKGVYHIP